jgi:hypothetical protein
MRALFYSRQFAVFSWRQFAAAARSLLPTFYLLVAQRLDRQQP